MLSNSLPLLLNHLYKVSSGGQSIGCRIYSSLSITDPQSLRLIQECLSLEDKIGCHGVTDIVLNNNGDSGCIWRVKKLILEDDWDAFLREASQHQSTAIAARIATRTTWPKL